jgi:hypothetical protein
MKSKVTLTFTLKLVDSQNSPNRGNILIVSIL